MTREELLQKHHSVLDKKLEWDDTERRRSTTYRKVINAIPSKLVEYVDDVWIDDEGIWVYLKQEYDFDDCSGAGTCHADTISEVKDCFKNGIAKHENN